MATKIQLRRDTAANWTAANTVLAAGEMGIETDTGKAKVGDGTTAWASLGYGMGTNTATAYAPGAMSAAQNNLLAALGSDWYTTHAIALGAAFPGVTRAIPVDMRNWPRGATVANAGTVPGGAAKIQGAAMVDLSTDRIVANPRTLPWGIAFRAQLSAPAAGQNFFVGVGQGVTTAFALAHNFDDSTYATADPTKTKLAIMRWAGALNYDIVGNWVIDTVAHDFMLGSDTVNVSWYLDGVLKGILPLSDGLGPTTPSSAIVQAALGSSFLLDFMYAF